MSNLAGLLQRIGVQELEIRDDEVWGLCPGHERRTKRADNHPSWSMNIDPEHEAYGYHHCFSCGYGGHLYGLVAEMQNWTYADDDGEEILDKRRAKKWVFRHLEESVLEEAVSRRAKWREESRKVERPPMSEARLALFGPPPNSALRARDIDRDIIDRYGVLWDGKRDAWILPIRRPGGRLLGWQLKSDRFFLNYPKGVAKRECVFGIDELPPTTSRVAVLESPLDVCRLATATEGCPGVATFGSVFSTEQIRALAARYEDRVVLAFDNDKAGHLATAEFLLDHRRRFSYVQLLNYAGAPDAKDIGDMDDAQILAAIADARPYTQLPKPVRRATELIKKERARALRRKTSAVPARGRRAHGRPRQGARRL